MRGDLSHPSLAVRESQSIDGLRDVLLARTDLDHDRRLTRATFFFFFSLSLFVFDKGKNEKRRRTERVLKEISEDRVAVRDVFGVAFRKSSDHISESRKGLVDGNGFLLEISNDP